MVLHVAVAVAYLFLFSAIIRSSKFFALNGIPNKWMLLAFWLKILAGFVLWMVYTYHYTYRDTSDSYRFFDDAIVIRNLLSENPSMFFRFMFGIGLDQPDVQPIMNQMHGWTSMYGYGLPHDSPTIIRINVLISLFSFGYYHVHTVFMCMMSFMGLTYLFKAFVFLFTGKERILFVACYLLPSVIFWSSGVLKEAPLLCAFGIFVYHGMKLYREGWNTISMLLISLATFILIFLKIYVLISMIPSVIFLLWINRFGDKYMIVKFLVVHVLCFTIAQNAGYFFTGGDFLHILERKQTDFYNVVKAVNAKSVIEIPPVTNTLSYFMHYPRAMFLVLFRPHIGEMKTVFYAVFAIENLFYLMALIITLIRFRIPEKSQLIVLLTMLSFVLVLGGIIGSTVPVLGAVIRYRIILLPVYVMLLLGFTKPIPFFRSTFG